MTPTTATLAGGPATAIAGEVAHFTGGPLVKSCVKWALDNRIGALYKESIDLLQAAVQIMHDNRNIWNPANKKKALADLRIIDEWKAKVEADAAKTWMKWIRTTKKMQSWKDANQLHDLVLEFNTDVKSITEQSQRAEVEATIPVAPAGSDSEPVPPQVSRQSSEPNAPPTEMRGDGLSSVGGLGMRVQVWNVSAEQRNSPEFHSQIRETAARTVIEFYPCMQGLASAPTGADHGQAGNTPAGARNEQSDREDADSVSGQSDPFSDRACVILTVPDGDALPEVTISDGQSTLNMNEDGVGVSFNDATHNVWAEGTK